MNCNTLKENVKFEDLIYEIRGKQVMFDFDLARIYECSNGTKTINQAVKRHINRFPERFMFQLTKEEYNKFLWSQVGTAKLNNMSRTLLYVFIEQGVAMLATVLKTSVASKMSTDIMRAFIAICRYLSSNLINQ